MKILIISLPRTGSTSLLKDYAKKYNLKPFSEPFSIYSNDNYNFEDNSIVKSIISQKSIDFYKEYSKNFNKVILLSRKNLKECAESMAYLNYYLDKGFSHDKEYSWKPTPNLPETINYIKDCNKSLKILSEYLNIPISYYEDLFNPNSDKRLRKTQKNIL